MKKHRKRTGFSKALLLAVAVTALTPTLTRAQDLGDLNEQILANPQDSALNLRYARAAEEQGKLRLALVAYERVLINEPENVEARRGYERVRRQIEPGYTVLRLETGIRYDTNPLNSAFSDEEAVSYFVEGTLTDEHRVGDSRFRSSVNFQGEVTPDISELNHGFIGAQTGPILYMGPHFAAIPTIGAGIGMLEGDYYYSDINAGLTLEGKTSSTSYWTRFQAGWRSYSTESIADEGVYAEAIGGISFPQLLSETDTLVLVPWVRWSDIDGSIFSFFSGDIAPGKFTEAGIDATYNYQLSDHFMIYARAVARERFYNGTTTFGGDDRRDTYVAPEVGVTVRDILPCECAVRVAYKYRDNDSNDFVSDFDAEQVSLSLQTRF